MNDSTVLVTGANGFVGGALCSAMRRERLQFMPVMRNSTSDTCGFGIVKDIHPSSEWHNELNKVGTVVHLAGRVHMTHDTAPDTWRDYRRANVDSTLNLASQAAKFGVRRFIYLSSIKVNGESTFARPFSELDIPVPVDPYGVSKYEAELGLQEISQRTGLEVVIIRPPLVYGPRVRANFLQLMQWVKSGVPLPFASVDNRRSMVFIDNLVDLILRCLKHPAAAGRTFLVSDDHDVSVPELIRILACAMGKRAILFPLPPSMLMMLARVVGKANVAERLLNSLQVDMAQTKNVLEWTPPYSFELGIEKTVKYFVEQGILKAQHD